MKRLSNEMIAFTEAFASGKASWVVSKLGAILSRKIGKLVFSTVPIEYENSYGVFAGYLGKLSGNVFLKINFLLSKSDSIYSYDVYTSGLTKSPDYTVDVFGLNIVEILNSIIENLIDDGEADVEALTESADKLRERGRPSIGDPADFQKMMDSWTKEDPKMVDDLQRKSLTDVFSKSFLPWAKDKPNYAVIKYYFFVKIVKRFLLERGLTNKTFRVRKKGTGERQIQDPILQSQLEDITESITWKEKFDFLKGLIGQMYNGNIQAIYLYGDPGCLSKDTVLSIARGKRKDGREYTIEEAYIKLNRVGESTVKRERGFKYWNSKYATKVLSYNPTGYLEYKQIKGITKSGKKEVFLVVTENGKMIKASKDHRFKVEGKENFISLSDIFVGDRILTQDTTISTKGRDTGRRIIYDIPFHPYAYKNVSNGFDYKRYPYAKLLVEAELNGITVEDFVDILKHDKIRATTLKYLSSSEEVHHKDGNQANDMLCNLEVLSKEDHTRKHYQNSKLANQEVRVSYDTISQIELVGIEETYDIEMQDLNQPTFLAQGIVVHNSGKSYETKAELDRLKAEYTVFSGAAKPEAFIQILYNHREDEIMVLDDFSDKLLKDQEIVNVLKAALQNQKSRTITYAKNPGKGLDFPPQFEFTSGIIFISNYAKLDSAIASRSAVLELTFSNEEVIEKIDATLKAFRPEVSFAMKKEALEYAREVAPGVKSIDYRMLDNILTAMQITKSDWKRMALLLMQSIN